MSELLAKDTGHTLFAHTLDVVNAARQVVENLPEGRFSKDDLHHVLDLCAAFHDVGKAATGFQAVLKREQPHWHHRRHEIISTAFAAHCDELSEEARLAILTHHRSLPPSGPNDNAKGSLDPFQLPGEGGEAWDAMAAEWESNREAFRRFWRAVCEAIERPDLIALENSPLQDLGLNRVWLDKGRGKRSQLKVIPPERRELASLYRGLLITSDHMASGGTPPKSYPNLRSVAVCKYPTREFQDRCYETEGHAILRAPTGSGKTEAALLWMQANWRKNSRVFYVLPYMASINAMHHRLKETFGDDVVGVLHSKAGAYLYSLRENDASPQEAQSHAYSLKGLAGEMYFPIRVCTPHQILRYALRGRGWEQMLAEFPQGCFIFDEIHAYDAQITGLILGAAKLVSQWDARLLFASATLPDFLKRVIQDAVSIPDDQDHFIQPDPTKTRDGEILDKKRHQIEVWDGSLLDRLDDILHEIERATHTLIVCNHIKTAITVFRKVEQRFSNEVMLLHSRFAAQDRANLEKDLSKKLPRVLVATQVVEVSLNIDFHQAFFEPAPIDALAQRMGRVNRTGSRPPERVVVMHEQVSRHRLYDSDRSRQTVEELSTLNNPVSEDDLVSIANRVYRDGFNAEQQILFDMALSHPDLTEIESQLVAGAYQDWAERVLDQSDERVEVLPDYYEAKYQDLIERKLWLPATSLLVPVRSASLKNLQNDPRRFRFVDTSVKPWIVHCPYDPKMGLDLEATLTDELD